MIPRWLHSDWGYLRHHVRALLGVGYLLLVGIGLEVAGPLR